MLARETASHVVIMGPTGSGKSTFINLVSGSTLSVSDGLRSCTFDVVESRPFSLDDQNMILVDTPGFDDTTRSDTDIISTISTHLANLRRQGVKVCGVIYMHRISDVRIGGTSLLNFRIFHKLCGDECLPNALIVTTMWSRVSTRLGERREQELSTAEDLFKPVLDKGARLVRHHGTLQSAQDILRFFNTNKRMTLRIQRELVDEGKELVNTAAGAELTGLLAKQAERLEARNRRLQKQMVEASYAKDQKGVAVIQLELEETQKQKRRVKDEHERLRRMVPLVIDPDLVRRVSTELVEHLGRTAYLSGNLQSKFSTIEQDRVELQGRSNEPPRTTKRTSMKIEQLEDASEVLNILKDLKSRSKEQSDELRNGEDNTTVAERAETAEEIQRQFDVAIERQANVIDGLKKRTESDFDFGCRIC